MSKIIDYYFTSVSPFTFLGHDALMTIAEKHGCQVNFKPFNLFGVWEVSEAVPPMKRPPVRQRYRLIELQRIAEMRGVDIVLKPTHFPTDPTLADHSIIAVAQAGGDVAGFARSVSAALWQGDKQLNDEATIAELIKAVGMDPATLLAAAKSEGVSAARAANTQAAIEHDAIGAPAYVYDGEVFWGQDRLDYLERMIATGRAAYTA